VVTSAGRAEAGAMLPDRSGRKRTKATNDECARYAGMSARTDDA
jgi:hypothetical protein